MHVPATISIPCYHLWPYSSIIHINNCHILVYAYYTVQWKIGNHVSPNIQQPAHETRWNQAILLAMLKIISTWKSPRHKMESSRTQWSRRNKSKEDKQGRRTQRAPDHRADQTLAKAVSRGFGPSRKDDVRSYAATVHVDSRIGPRQKQSVRTKEDESDACREVLERVRGYWTRRMHGVGPYATADPTVGSNG
jgi:hypothetical protein